MTHKDFKISKPTVDLYNINLLYIFSTNYITKACAGLMMTQTGRNSYNSASF